MPKVWLHNFEHELEEKFVTSSGPGGQNVNKVASAVQLRFNLLRSGAFSEEEKARIVRSLGPRITDGGDIILFVQEQRSQTRNREAARERLVAMLEKALIVPKRRVPTRPSRAAKQRRLDTKSIRSEVKRGRGKIETE